MSQIHQSPTNAPMCHLLVSNNFLVAQIKLLMLPEKIQISTWEGYFHLSNITIYLIQSEKNYELAQLELTIVICWSQKNESNTVTSLLH